MSKTKGLPPARPAKPQWSLDVEIEIHGRITVEADTIEDAWAEASALSITDIIDNCDPNFDVKIDGKDAL